MLRPPGPPFSLDAVTFRFPALAGSAGSLPIGSGREAALAALLVARLAADAIPPGSLPLVLRAERATAARHWLGATCPDARVRNACAAVAEATGGDDGALVGRALTGLIEAISHVLDEAARMELAALARAFAG